MSVRSFWIADERISSNELQVPALTWHFAELRFLHKARGDVPTFGYTTRHHLCPVARQPFVHGLPERLGGAVAVATADVDEAAELADSRDVSTIPHFVLLRSGVQVCALVGIGSA